MYEDIVLKASELGHPTEGPFADLWRLASGSLVPIDMASNLYKDCGYEPFAGYPLVRRKGVTS